MVVPLDISNGTPMAHVSDKYRASGCNAQQHNAKYQLEFVVNLCNNSAFWKKKI